MKALQFPEKYSSAVTTISFVLGSDDSSSNVLLLARMVVVVMIAGSIFTAGHARRPPLVQHKKINLIHLSSPLFSNIARSC